MKKEELKTGMLIVNKEGRKGLVMLNTSVGDNIVGNGNDSNDEQTWLPMKDLRMKDVLQVWSYPYNANAASFNYNERTLIWENKMRVVQLTREYRAKINENNKTIQIGCQTISFEKVEEVYNLIQKLKS